MSEKDPRAIFPGEKHSGFTICSQCLSIPFDKLPAEQEAAYPHYPSLTDLKASARTCPLCALLDQALTEETQRLNDEKHQTGIVLGDFAATLGEELPNPVIGYVESLKQWQKLRLRPDKKTLEVRDFGRWPAATFEDVELAKYGVVAGNPVKLPPQILGAGKSHADSELGIRPWVYGNWWLLDQPDESQGRTIKKDYYRLQLIGIGVRLTEMPTPHACKTYDRDVVHLRGSSLRVFTEFGDPAMPYIPGRIREMFSGSLKFGDLIQFWTRCCELNHDCQPKDAPLLPTRVLEVELKDTYLSIRLLETHGERGKYLALSYSWGKTGILKTTHETLQAHKSGIPSKKLPQAFSDAIQIALGLGLCYVWIDSLCIIQGDFADWEREAPKMAQVYSNAHLTVSASCALNPSEGCFPRARMFEYTPMDNLSTGAKERWHHQNFVPVQTSISFRQSSKLFFNMSWMPPSEIDSPTVYRIGNFGQKYDPLAFESLSSRAWTLQERLLSPRVLHFTKEQMYWECKRCFMSEDGTRFDPTTFSLDAVICTHNLNQAPEDQRYCSFVPEINLPNEESGRFKGGWLSIVHDFSKRRLTYPNEKLPALSGLASIIASRTGDTYLCGLWKQHIYQDLCWRVNHSPVVENELKIRDIRLEPDRDINTPGLREVGIVLRDDSQELEIKRIPTRAPSWSWASMDAPVLFEQLQADRIVARLINHEVRPFGNDKFGRVSSGFLILQAPLLPMQIRDLKASTEWIRTSFDNKNSSKTPVLIKQNGETAAGFATFDLKVSFPCFALFLDSAYALVLISTGNADMEFQRIGLAKFLPTDSQANTSYLKDEKHGEILCRTHEESIGPIGPDPASPYVRIV